MMFRLVWILLMWNPIAPQQGSKPAPPPGLPAADGVYFRQADGIWAGLERATTRSSNLEGINAYLQTAGQTNLDVHFVFKGAHAPIQFAEPRPTFYVRGVGPPQDAMIVRLSAKKDSRTVQTLSSASGVSNKGGFKSGDLRKVTTISFSGGCWSLSPEADLKPGEYLLVFGYATVGYDFGIANSRKRN